jgi:hypothetical protein
LLAARLLVSLVRGANHSDTDTDSDEEAYAAGVLLALHLRMFREKMGYKL